MRNQRKILIPLFVITVLLASILLSCAPVSTPGQTTTITPQVPSQTTGPVTTSKPNISSAPATTVPASDTVFKFKWAEHASPTHPRSALHETPLAEAIEAASNGRIEITQYYSETLVKSREGFDAVRMGITQMGEYPASYSPGKFTFSDITNLPFPVKDMWNVHKVTNALIDAGWYTEFDEVKLFGFGNTGPYNTLFRDINPQSLEDIKGIKVRSSGGYINDWLAALGMIPVTITSSELYTSYERGLVTAYHHIPSSMASYKIYEIPSKVWLVLNSHTYGNVAMIMNKDAWNSLPEDLQQIVFDEFRKSQKSYYHSYVDQDGPALQEFLNRGVVEVTWPDSEMAKVGALVPVVWNKFIADNSDKATDIKEFMKAFAKEFEKYGEQAPFDLSTL